MVTYFVLIIFCFICFVFFQIVIVVTIDLTKSDCATTLYKWLILVNSKINNFVEDSQKDSSTETQVTGLEETKESKVRRNKSTRPPVLVVGCKADTLEATGVESMAESKAKQGALRAVCLHGNHKIYYLRKHYFISPVIYD